MPADTNLSRDFQLLSARLNAMHDEIVRQGRARPLADVPPETEKAARRLMQDIRRFTALTTSQRILRTVPRPLQFSPLALLLGDAQARFADFGARHTLDRPLPGTLDAQMEETKGNLMHIITDASAEIRRTRDADRKERLREEKEERAREREYRKWERDNQA